MANTSDSSKSQVASMQDELVKLRADNQTASLFPLYIFYASCSEYEFGNDDYPLFPEPEILYPSVLGGQWVTLTRSKI